MERRELKEIVKEAVKEAFREILEDWKEYWWRFREEWGDVPLRLIIIEHTPERTAIRLERTVKRLESIAEEIAPIRSINKKIDKLYEMTYKIERWTTTWAPECSEKERIAKIYETVNDIKSILNNINNKVDQISKKIQNSEQNDL